MKVLVLNGPNLNMLGRRDPAQYGTTTLAQIEINMRNYINWDFTFFQSNHEGALIDKIHSSLDYDGIIINPGGLTHTSVSLKDALDIFPGCIVEVHLSNIDDREEYRKVNYVKECADHTIVGEKENGYIIAIDYLKSYFNVI